MQIKFFTIPIGDNGTMTEELNRFLRSHKVLEVENHLISNEKGALWCFCVKFIPSVYSGSENDKIKMDYKNELDEPTFKIFFTVT
jgi:hypothetical protein